LWIKKTIIMLGLDGVQILHGKGHFWKGHMPAHYNVPTMGECACPAHAADESIRRREGWQDGDAVSCQITSDTCFMMRI